MNGSSLDYVPKTKKSRRKSNRRSVETVYRAIRPTPSDESNYLGDIWIGTTNNVPPENWDSCDVKFITVDEDDTMIVSFGKTLMVVKITSDVQFLKDMFHTKLFCIDIKIDDSKVAAGLYLNKLPLPKFNSKIGSVLKVIFHLTFNVHCQFNEINTIISSFEIEQFHVLLKNISPLRNKILDFALYHDQLKPILRPYQQDAVRWMLSKEKSNEQNEILHPLYEEITLKSGLILYFDKYNGYLHTEKPLVNCFNTGGILADEMGLGKTVEVLALILLNNKEINVDSNINCNNDCNTSMLDKTENAAEESAIETDCENDELNKTESLTEESPSVFDVEARKRKRSKPSDSSTETYVIEKRSKTSKTTKSNLRLALESWYNKMLAGDNKPVESTVQCICGNTDEEDTVECVDCQKLQHAACLGYKKKYGPYVCPQCWTTKPLLESRATLIVTPPFLKQQWCDEICKHVHGNFKVLQYGTGQRLSSVYPNEFQEYDVVITTYNVLQTELRLSENGQSLSLRKPPKYSLPGSPIGLIKWWRLCLDEAQTVETPGSMVSVMAKKLSAHHRWAITGTPISKDISDIYGLVDYLQISPYNELETWSNILYKPYINGRKENMHRFLSNYLWRTVKDDVLEQINIPRQTTEEHWVEFTAVEKFLYEREHELSSSIFLSTLKNMDLDVPMKLLNKSALKKIMTPLLALRQACVHHQTVKGRYLVNRKQVGSMADLLDALLAKSLGQCEENLRTMVSAINGLASVFLLQNDNGSAAEMYRKVLRLSEEYSSGDADVSLEVDRLLLIHATYNLAEVLDLNPSIARESHDGDLRDRWERLEQEYIDKIIKQVVAVLNENSRIRDQIDEMRAKFVLPAGHWFADTVDWMTRNDHFHEYVSKFSTMTENAAVNFTVKSERAVLYKITTWDEHITEIKENLLSHIDGLFVYEDGRCTVPVAITEAASECHLRPTNNKKKNKKECPVCVANTTLKEYENVLFDSELKLSGDANAGVWKPSAQEYLIKALYNLGKSHKAPEELIHDGEIHLNILELLRKEFKEIRKLWTCVDRLICEKDELDMCKLRLQLSKPKEVEEGNAQTLRLLKQLNDENVNKYTNIHYIDETQIPYQLAHLSSQERCSLKVLEANIGTYKYLRTLHKQQTKGEDPDPCPICKTTLDKQWNILTCGHCFCLECTQLMTHTAFDRPRQQISCAICRKSIRITDISFIVKSKTETAESDIKGNCSSKVEAVVRLILKLRDDAGSVKVIVFSSFPAVLKLLQEIFTENGINARVVLSAQSTKNLNEFKDAGKGVTALVLPIYLGGKGLNIIEATHVIFVEPLLNPADELQAIGRVHRIGQTKPTVVHKFFTKNTIEESIRHTMESKGDEWDENRVTLGHIKQLFDYGNFSSGALGALDVSGGDQTEGSFN